MNTIGLYLDIQDNKPVKYKADLAVSGIEITASRIKISLVFPANIELKIGTYIVLLYGMFGGQSGYVIRCRLDEIHPEYLKCSF